MADANWPADKVERWPVAKLVPNARNARTHSDEQVTQLAASIEEFGWTIPVLVDEVGGIIAGHGRILAAHRLGIEDVPVMVAAGWSDAKKRAYPAIYARFGLNPHLYNGRLTIFLDPVLGAVKVGDKITLKVGLQDPSMAQPVQDRITIKIIEETAPSKTTKRTKTKSKASAGDAGNKEGDGKPAPTHGLPQYKLLTEDGRKVGDIDT